MLRHQPVITSLTASWAKAELHRFYIDAFDGWSVIRQEGSSSLRIHTQGETESGLLGILFFLLDGSMWING